jgi:hypothetical protein
VQDHFDCYPHSCTRKLFAEGIRSSAPETLLIEIVPFGTRPIWRRLRNLRRRLFCFGLADALAGKACTLTIRTMLEFPPRKFGEVSRFERIMDL